MSDEKDTERCRRCSTRNYLRRFFSDYTKQEETMCIDCLWLRDREMVRAALGAAVAWDTMNFVLKAGEKPGGIGQPPAAAEEGKA